MTLPRPTASLLLDGGGASLLAGSGLSAAQAGVRRLVVELSVDEAHDRVELAVWRGSALSERRPGRDADGRARRRRRRRRRAHRRGRRRRRDRLGRGDHRVRAEPPAVLDVRRPVVRRPHVGDVVSDLLARGTGRRGRRRRVAEPPGPPCRPAPLGVGQPARSGAHDAAARSPRRQDGSVSFTPIPGAVAGGLGGALGGVAGSRRAWARPTSCVRAPNSSPSGSEPRPRSRP